MPSSRKLRERRRAALIERQFHATMARKLTDQVTAFICGGLDRERHMRWDWLEASGMLALWRATDYGQIPEPARAR